jgi:hypothetical protein
MSNVKLFGFKANNNKNAVKKIKMELGRRQDPAEDGQYAMLFGTRGRGEIYKQQFSEVTLEKRPFYKTHFNSSSLVRIFAGHLLLDVWFPLLRLKRNYPVVKK